MNTKPSATSLTRSTVTVSDGKELARTEDSPVLGHELPADLRALAAIIVNMLARHTHEQRVAVLRFALEKEKYIPVAKSSVFSGTSIMPSEEER